MKPSNPQTRQGYWLLLWTIPMTIYCAALGWEFVLGLLGFSLLAHTMNALCNRIVPGVTEKKP